MPNEQITIGGCKKCGGEGLTCKYNRFESDDLRIDSWEHKCPDCGYRVTTAIRTDDEDAPEGPPDICPYCQRKAGV